MRFHIFLCLFLSIFVQAVAIPAGPQPWSLWQISGGGEKGYIDLQASGVCVTSKGKGQWNVTSDGKLSLILAGRRTATLAPSGVNWAGGNLLLTPISQNYINGRVDSPAGVTANDLPGTLWAFRSKSWNGYIDFRDKGVYWTHWGLGNWTLSPQGLLTMKNQYDGFTFSMQLNRTGTQFAGRRSGTEQVNFLLLGRY